MSSNTKKRTNDAIDEPATADENGLAPLTNETIRWPAMNEGERVWTIETYPKPAHGLVLLTWIEQRTGAAIMPYSYVQYTIPVNVITDAQWDMMVTCHDVVYVASDTYDDMVGEENAKKVCEMHGYALPKYLDSIHRYRIPRYARAPTDGSVTATITCGVLSD